MVAPEDRQKQPGVAFDKGNRILRVTAKFEGSWLNVTSFPEERLDWANECANEIRQAKTISEFEDIRLKWIRKRTEASGRKFPNGRTPKTSPEAKKRGPKPKGERASGPVERILPVTDYEVVDPTVDIPDAIGSRVALMNLLADLLDKQSRFEEASVEVSAAYKRFRDALPAGIKRLMSVEDIAAALIAEQRGGGDAN